VQILSRLNGVPSQIEHFLAALCLMRAGRDQSGAMCELFLTLNTKAHTLLKT
jgi:hypothetical protein